MARLINLTPIALPTTYNRILMKKELEERLRQDYPAFFRDLYGDPTKTCLAFGIQCGDGWYDILRRLCQKIAPIVGPDFRVEQVKEKFGTLRFYVGGYVELDDGPMDQLHAAIEQAELESARTCEECGSEDSVTTAGKFFLRTICAECRSGKCSSL